MSQEIEFGESRGFWSKSVFAMVRTGSLESSREIVMVRVLYGKGLLLHGYVDSVRESIAAGRRLVKVSASQVVDPDVLRDPKMDPRAPAGLGEVLTVFVYLDSTEEEELASQGSLRGMLRSGSDPVELKLPETLEEVSAGDWVLLESCLDLDREMIDESLEGFPDMSFLDLERPFRDEVSYLPVLHVRGGKWVWEFVDVTFSGSGQVPLDRHPLAEILLGHGGPVVAVINPIVPRDEKPSQRLVRGDVLNKLRDRKVSHFEIRDVTLDFEMVVRSLRATELATLAMGGEERARALLTEYGVLTGLMVYFPKPTAVTTPRDLTWS